MRWLIRLAAVFTLFVATPASAAWVKAETDRFIVYGDSWEGDVRGLAQRLTTFDAILRIYHPTTAANPPGRKLSVYLVRETRSLARARPGGAGGGLRGFYLANSDDVFALVLNAAEDTDDFLFHEYAHYFMMENFPAAYPAWYVEGWAEYFMTTEVTPNGGTVGGYNQDRVYELQNSNWIPLEEVISTRPADQSEAEQRSLYYAEAWLLTHYMRSDPERARQLDQAVLAISRGEDPKAAFQRAIGMDFQQLTRRLRGYTQLQVMKLKNVLPTVPKITVSRMSPAADDLMMERLRLAMIETGAAEPAFLAEVRKRAARYPGDSLAELTLAQTEFKVGDVAKGEAIVDRRLTANPEDAESLLVAGLGQIYAGVRQPEDQTARFRKARPLLAKAYKLDNKEYRALFGYGVSRSIEPKYPTKTDLEAWLEARALAPSVSESSLYAAAALLKADHSEQARSILMPVVNSPHGGRMAEAARAMLAARTAKGAEAVLKQEAALPTQVQEQGAKPAP